MNIERITGARINGSIMMVDNRWDLIYLHEEEIRAAQKFTAQLGGRPLSTSAYGFPPDTVMVGIISSYTMDDDSKSW